MQKRKLGKSNLEVSALGFLTNTAFIAPSVGLSTSCALSTCFKQLNTGEN